MKRPILKLFLKSVTIVLVIFCGTQIVQSLLQLVTAGSNLIQLTLVEPENNDIQQHPYYTVCPILESSANLSDPDADFLSVITENAMYYPVATSLKILNSQSLTVKQSSTWVKMKDAGKDKTVRLVHCTTFHIPKEITLGRTEAKVTINNRGQSSLF